MQLRQQNQLKDIKKTLNNRSSGGSCANSSASSARINVVMSQYLRASASRKMNTSKEGNPFQRVNGAVGAKKQKSLIVIVDNSVASNRSVDQSTLIENEQEERHQVVFCQNQMSRSNRSSSPAYSSNSSGGPFSKNACQPKWEGSNDNASDTQFIVDPLIIQMSKLAILSKQKEQGKRSCGNISVSDDYGQMAGPITKVSLNQQTCQRRLQSKGSSQATVKSPFISQRAPAFFLQSSCTQSAKRLFFDETNMINRESSQPDQLSYRKSQPENTLKKALFLSESLKQSIISNNSITKKENISDVEHREKLIGKVTQPIQEGDRHLTSQMETMQTDADECCENVVVEECPFQMVSSPRPRNMLLFQKRAVPIDEQKDQEKPCIRIGSNENSLNRSVKLSTASQMFQKQGESKHRLSSTSIYHNPAFIKGSQCLPLSAHYLPSFSPRSLQLEKRFIAKTSSSRSLEKHSLTLSQQYNPATVSRKSQMNKFSIGTEQSSESRSKNFKQKSIKSVVFHLPFPPCRQINQHAKKRNRSNAEIMVALTGSIKYFNVEMLIQLSSTSKHFAKRKDAKYAINSQFRFLVIQGLSTFDRLRFWNHRTRFGFYRRKYQGLYYSILDKQSLSEHPKVDLSVHEIQKDTDRTLPNLSFFKEKGGKGQLKLERLLTAVALYYKKLGYVQGMNFLAAALVLSFSGSEESELVREEESFWMMISVLVNFKYDQLLTFENEKFKVLCFQIDMCVKAFLPEVYQIFNERCAELTADYYASPWLLTFFAVLNPQKQQQKKNSDRTSLDSSVFDLNFVLTAIDLFLLEGVISLIRVCLGILSAIKEDLEDLTYEETLVYMKTFSLPSESQSNRRSLLWNVTTDIETFYRNALKFTVTRQMLSELETYYWSKESKDSLSFDHDTRKWSVTELTNHHDDTPIKERSPQKSFSSRVKGLFTWFNKKQPDLTAQEVPLSKQISGISEKQVSNQTDHTQKYNTASRQEVKVTQSLRLQQHHLSTTMRTYEDGDDVEEGSEQNDIANKVTAQNNLQPKRPSPHCLLLNDPRAGPIIDKSTFNDNRLQSIKGGSMNKMMGSGILKPK